MVLTIDLIKRHYRRAERAIKRCEMIALAVPTPAVNQLRYAGNHALKAMTAIDADLQRQELEDAERHCKRAWFDAFDSITCYHLQLIKEFEGKNYPVKVLEKFLPNYLDDLQDAQRIYRLYRLPETVQQMSFDQRLAMLHDMKRIGRFAKSLKAANEAYRAALSDADDVKLRWAKFGSTMSGLTSFAGSVFGIALSAMGLISVSPKDHPFVYAAGWAGIVTFILLLLANVILVSRSVWQVLKKGRPGFDS